MAEVNASDQTIINSEDDVFALYTGAGDDSKIGLEVELAFFDPKNLKPMSIAQNSVLKNAAQSRMSDSGDWIHTEPTAELLEVVSIPGHTHEIKNILSDINQKIKILSDKALELGLKRSYFQELPDQSAAELLKHIIKVDRYKAMYWPSREDMKDIVAYFAVCKSNQVSVSHKDPDHLLENVRRLYFMAPFLFLLTDNSAGFSQGKAFAGHQGMALRTALGNRGGVPPYVLTAQTGEDYIRAHINHVMNNPLFMAYDDKGNLNQIPSGTWSSFEKLRAQGLNTASNYYLAQSILWPDVKIAPLKNADGAVTGHRFEPRMFGVGIHQHQTATLIVNALAFKPDFANQVDALLAEYGFDTADLPTAHENLEAAYEAARNHDRKFFDIAYGTGTMIDFAKSFADLIEETYDGENLEEELEPLLSICRSGCTDGKVNHFMFPTLESVKQFQLTYPDNLFDNPNTCAHVVFEKKLRQESSSPCAQVQV